MYRTDLEDNSRCISTIDARPSQAVGTSWPAANTGERRSKDSVASESVPRVGRSPGDRLLGASQSVHGWACDGILEGDQEILSL